MIARLTRALSRRARNDGWIPWTFFAFFGVVVLVNGTMIWIAISTWTGISGENANSYRQGLTYNDRLADVRAQDALGWTADLLFERGDPAQGRLSLVIADDDEAPLHNAQVTASLLRPTHPGHDFAVPLLSTEAPGTYSAEIAFPLPGQWDLRVTAEHEQGTYRLSQRLFVP